MVNMTDQIIQFVSQFPREVAVILLASFPVTELRLAIPLAMHSWQFSPYQAFLLAIIGNLIPLVPLYFGLDFLRDLGEKYAPWTVKWIDRIVDRSRNRVEEKYNRYGAIALFLFTALPLPMTGLYTATLAATVLKIPFKFAAPAIISGVFTAGIIVTILSYSAELYF